MDWENWADFIFAGSLAFSGWMTSRATQQIARFNERLTWFTGAMESHSEIMMRLTAQRDGVPVVYWDPNEEAVPTEPLKKHKASADIKTVYQYLPTHLRKKSD